ncbi:hypothetical protein MRX96_004833 [Rhipicephalus microplus]
MFILGAFSVELVTGFYARLIFELLPDGRAPLGTQQRLPLVNSFGCNSVDTQVLGRIEQPSSGRGANRARRNKCGTI